MNNTSFNLLIEPWIPCVLLDGRTTPLGIRETLAASHLIREIVDPSPIVAASLHRLLLAVVHSVLRGPKNSDEWASLWSPRTFHMEQFDRYFEQWKSRFDLFDAAQPFYQWPNLDLSQDVPVTKLTHELASGNNATLFDHTTELNFTAAEAARYLVSQQNYGVGGLVSAATGESRAQFGSATAAPLTDGALILVRGDTLFETLLLNLLRYHREEAAPFPFDEEKDDTPAWEQPVPSAIQVRRPRGYLDYLTWQSRRILLLTERDSDEAFSIRRVVLMKGDQLDPSFSRELSETMQGFKGIAKPAAGQRPWVAVGFREDRSLWRDSLALMQSVDNKYPRPKNLSWLDILTRRGLIDSTKTLPLDLYGISTDKAKVLLWRHERLGLPFRYLLEKDLQQTLGIEMGKAENVGRALWAATLNLAKLLLSPDAEDRGREAPAREVGRLASRFGTKRLYWAQLEPSFHLLLRDLAQGELPPSGIAPAALAWRQTLRTGANSTFASVTNGLDGSIRTLKASARSQRLLHNLLHSELGPTEHRNEGDIPDGSAS